MLNTVDRVITDNRGSTSLGPDTWVWVRDGISAVLGPVVRWLLWSVFNMSCVSAKPASASPGKVIAAPRRGLLKRERHRLEIKSRLVCLLQKIYAEISVEEFAGFGSVRQQDHSGAEDYRECSDAETE